MEIDICNNTEFVLEDKHIQLFYAVAEASLNEEKHSTDAEVSLSLVTNEEIQQINKKFRKIDRPTDVLSFPSLEEEFLGDIIISIEKATEQANEYGHSLERELGFLVAHSMLHLMGYDHMDEPSEKEMFEKQETILNRCSLKREKGIY